jgi:hypothetical protein
MPVTARSEKKTNKNQKYQSVDMAQKKTEIGTNPYTFGHCMWIVSATLTVKIPLYSIFRRTSQQNM